MTKKKAGGKAAGHAKPNSVGAGSKPKHSLDANRPSKGPGFQRDAATVRRLTMYKKRAVRDKKGRIIHEDLQSKDLPTTRIQPDRRWFGNTRVIGQKQLDQFRTEMSTKVNDAYTVLLKEKKLPLQLLEDPEKKRKGKQVRANLLTVQPFEDTFGSNAQRKRPRLAVDNLEELVNGADQRLDSFEEPAVGDDTFREGIRERAMEKGQSRRIWGELYKVLDSSDVIIQVLDARDPMGTRCFFLEQHIRKHLRHKHLLLLLNKCDLVPSWVTKRWLHTLSREFPTLAFHASITNPFGKGALLSLLRQLARLRSDRQAISVGFVGYPNVGKSSVINTLRTKKVCKTAPVPGETKIWQYITLMKRVFLIDCPGVVYNKTSDSESDIVLKGVIRVENLEDATEHIPMVLQRVKPEYLRRAYKIKEWTDHEDFLTQLAKLSGKLLKGGDADLNTAARMVLYDWQRGKIPFFTLPPDYKEEEEVAAAKAEVPVPAQAVTEEDALLEAGARPENAMEAARAAQDLLHEAITRQTKMAIPVQQDYFMPEDEKKGKDDVDADLKEDDLISSGTDDEAEEEGGSDASVSSEDAGDDEEEEAAPQTRSKSGTKASVSGRKAAAAAPVGKKGAKGRANKKKGGDDDEEDSGDESDGYGAGGLSWEAVLAAVKGNTEQPAGSSSDDDAQPSEDQEPAPPPAKRARKKGAPADAEGMKAQAKKGQNRQQRKKAAGGKMKTME
eukprot:CAMPEP_0202868082 /NCGR_PEP_ID=MMETSP1391-20130828/10164_1 /ASSEMBLY_ACC=CAM_ASM_000867 /TAXON_ID=1034604 /ORGANISM="Chlamydomonas leiostraca, Strain SAG 11-49" /LENGTH=726 /DNA_ID=CAMNT_0049548195 /DNA_START=12 /DNA_END=2192 /DNA_ORIENTATION=+